MTGWAFGTVGRTNSSPSYSTTNPGTTFSC